MNTTPDMPSLLPERTGPSGWSWRLHVLTSGDPAWLGRVLRLGTGTWTIGREPGDTPGPLQTGDTLVSRVHLRLSVRASAPTLAVEDLASRNGTWVNGETTVHAEMSHGSVLRFGNTVAVLEGDSGRHHGFEVPTAEVPGHSERARQIRHQLERAAQAVLPTFIVGATGTGKEHAASEIHRRSGRRGALVRLNVAAVPESLFEAELFGSAQGAYTGAQKARNGRIVEANGGTLVLDEIGELPMQLQPKLLRVLEERTIRPLGAATDTPVDVKFLASTNANLDELVQQGRFRADLLARLRSQMVFLPPLADRRSDMLDLADVVVPVSVATASATRRWQQILPAEAVEALVLRPWPYNLRELRATLLEYSQHAADATALVSWLRPPATRRVVRETSDMIAPVYASSLVRNALPEVRGKRRGPSRAEMARLIAETGGNVEEMGRRLQCARRQVYRWLEANDQPLDLLVAARARATEEAKWRE